MTTCTHPMPRRAAPRSDGQRSPTLGTEPCTLNGSMLLQKGETFHSPSSPYSPSAPTLSISNIPRRSLTSPKDLEALVLESRKRVDELTKELNETLSLSADGVLKLSQREILPVPNVFLAQTIINDALNDIAEKRSQHNTKPKKGINGSTVNTRQTNHQHDSDSGIGSSISSGSLCGDSTSVVQDPLRTTSVYTPRPVSQKILASKIERHVLDDYATNKIKKFILVPLLKEEEFQEFHSLLEAVPKRIDSGKISCLRDLEKSLIFLAEYKAKSPSSYLVFCNTLIQSIHTTVPHLSDADLRRPTDRPYTNNYFVDLVEQVRQYARIMAATRQKKAEGQKLDEMDHKDDEKLKLHVEEGKPSELVRVRADGTIIPIDAGRKQCIDYDDDDDNDTVIDAEVARSMARKRKCDIGKVEYRTCRECSAVFTRACDLTKHEKTHSRPWKCSESDCRYHIDGWPTEKERDRHVNDKHSKDAALFKCLFEPCTYSSKRESNCKQHMEKAHGWDYVRAKSKKGEKLQKLEPLGTTKLVPAKDAAGASLPTPSSSIAFPPFSTPSSVFSHSPAVLSDESFSPPSENDIYDAGMPQLDHVMSGTDEVFNDAIFQSNSMLEHDPYFVNWHTTYSPQEVPELANTPGTGYSNSPGNASLPTNYEFNFTFEDPQFQSIQSRFPMWFPPQGGNDVMRNHVAFQAGQQQVNTNKWTNTNQADFNFMAQQYNNTTSYGNFMPTNDNTATNADFTLYAGGTGMANFDNNNLGGSMFPELDLGLGDQFHNAGQEESLYDDVDEVRPLQSTDDLMLEQFMNLDGENHDQGRSE